MSSFFNKVFGNYGEGDEKPESCPPKPVEGATESVSGDTSDLDQASPVHASAPAEQSPFSQAVHNQAPPSLPFEAVESGGAEPEVEWHPAVPLFSQPAPEEILPGKPAAPVAPNSTSHPPTPDAAVRLQLGKALRFVSVDVLGFSAKNVPETVYSEIPGRVIERRNPNGSATVPLSVLVSGLEPVYSTAFKQADMSANVTIPADTLPRASMMSAPTKVETAPGSAAHVKPLAPLSGIPGTSATGPQPKFRDLQEVNRVPDNGGQSAPLTKVSAGATPESEAANVRDSRSESPVREVSVDADFDDDDEWRQAELKAVFGLEKTMERKEVFELVLQLDGVRSAAYIEGRQTRFWTNGFGDMVHELGDLIIKVRQLSNEIGIHGAQNFAIETNGGSVAFFSEGNATLAVMAKGEEISRASKQRIIVVLRELVRGY